MDWPGKKPDPVSSRARELNTEIQALEQQIQKLNRQLGQPVSPRLRSTALPHGATVSRHEPAAAPAEPIFEEVDQQRLKAKAGAQEHFNELGVRKYDLAGLLRRVKDNLYGPAASNPQLINYLAAGGVQGLRPLRKEKRVQRNRFFALVITLLVILVGILAIIIRNH
jgi:cell division protein FtsB